MPDDGGKFSWVCVEFRACVCWRLNDLTSSRALETRRRCCLHLVLQRGNRNGCEGVMEMSTKHAWRHSGSCWRCWMVNLRSRIHAWGHAARLGLVLDEAMDDGSGTFAARSLVVVLLRVLQEHVFRSARVSGKKCVRGTASPRLDRRRTSAVLATIAVMVKHLNSWLHVSHVCWGWPRHPLDLRQGDPKHQPVS